MLSRIMPARNSLKHFQPDQSYHVYNRGVGKADIFLDTQDYQAFLRRLQLMLLPLEEAEKLQHGNVRIRLKNFSTIIQLQAFCLMPNHFHLMLHQSDQTAITEFMRALFTSYSMYFNLKYKRVGPLFQGRFKAAWVDNDIYMLHLSRYIHRNPIALGRNIYAYPYSSLQYYYEKHSPDWLQANEVEGLFTGKTEYVQFINDLNDPDSQAAEAAQYDLN